MYPKTRRKKSLNITPGERDVEEEDQKNTSKNKQQRRDLSIDTQTLFNLSGKIPFLLSFNYFTNLYLAPIGSDQSTAYISHLLHDADLPALVQMETIDQIKYFLDERAHLINQVCPKKHSFTHFFEISSRWN